MNDLSTGAALLIVVFVFYGIGAWIGNAVKLVNCDFEAPYRCEILHAVGIIPIASLFTVWVDSDSK